MPFSLSHPAAVLPFRRWCPQLLIFPALIFGSLAPDFGYFIHVWDLGAFAHTLVGSFVCDIPIALVMLCVFLKSRLALAALLPSPHRQFWSQWSAGILTMTPKTVLLLCLSALIGAWTHIVWDSFTHDSGWCVLAAPILSFPAVTLAGQTFPVYKILQYLSSAVGLIAVGVFYIRQLVVSDAADKKADHKRIVRLFCIVLAALLLSGLELCYQENNQTVAHKPELLHLGFLFVVNAISAFVMLFMGAAWINHIFEKR